MLIVDPRMGSDKLIQPLKLRGLPVSVEQIPFGDVSWLGNGPDSLISIGLEYKKIQDVLACIRDKRFSGHQLPGLRNSFEIAYLLVEGEFIPGDRGELLVKHGKKLGEIEWGKKPWMYREVSHWLTTMETRGGLRIRHTTNLKQTVAEIHYLYTWWTAQEFEEHRSHLALYEGKPDSDRMLDAKLFVRPTLTVKMAAQLRGIGWERAWEIGRQFKSPREMVNAPVERWLEIDGIGKTLANRIVGQLAGN